MNIDKLVIIVVIECGCDLVIMLIKMVVVMIFVLGKYCNE